MARKVRLDHKGVGAILLSTEVRRVIDAKAAEVAAAVDANPDVARHAAGPTGLRAEVRSYKTDRVAAAVTLAGPDAIGTNRKYGVFSRAAFAAGLPMRQRKR